MGCAQSRKQNKEGKDLLQGQMANVNSKQGEKAHCSTPTQLSIIFINKSNFQTCNVGSSSGERLLKPSALSEFVSWPGIMNCLREVARKVTLLC